MANRWSSTCSGVRKENTCSAKHFRWEEPFSAPKHWLVLSDINLMSLTKQNCPMWCRCCICCSFKHSQEFFFYHITAPWAFARSRFLLWSPNYSWNLLKYKKQTSTLVWSTFLSNLLDVAGNVASYLYDYNERQVLFFSPSLSESPEGIGARVSSENGELWLPSKCEGRQDRQTPQCPQTLPQQVHRGVWVLLLLWRDGHHKVTDRWKHVLLIGITFLFCLLTCEHVF